ncbi:hypothetical protein JZ751_003221 [Albula glossodonta]|uniref:G-protein coupled receptors family 3 profile domain-containing protein n=1 Tax=Albula glossodonta TaxID=121402 RepID=A0A8T2N8Z2_9TELE|nr:hypothetical protein JZ751_003221 [Albula glossodonta]
MWLLSLLLIIHVSHVSAAHPRSVPGGPRGVYESGDIIVGGLFPVHKQLVKNGVKQTSSVKCLGFDVGMFLRSQSMIYSLDMINKSPILPNLKLGYEMYDTCSDVTMAIKGALRLMEERSNLTHECLPSESTVSAMGTKAVVGERYSEGSIAIARLFALPLIPQTSNVRIILEEAIRLRINRTWVAGDTWSTASEIYSLKGIHKIGRVFGFVMKRNDVPGFEEHLLEEIRRVNFTVDNTTHISYDENGDPHLGYDVLYWDMKYGNVTVRRIGEYSPTGVIENLPEHLVSECRQITVTVYDCFKTCPSGQELNSNKDTCCKTCNACAINQFSKGGLEKCKSCQEDEYVSPKRDSCLKKQVTYLNWLDGFAITLMVFGAAGLIFTLLVAVLFIRHWNTPIVKGTGGNLCLVILLALVASFCSIYTFFGKPSDASCKAGLPLFAISFTLCVSCILANLFQISVGFAFDVKVRDRLKRLNRPGAIATTCTAVQVALCGVWLSLFPPRLQQISSYSRKIVIQCHIGSNAMFGTTMGYIGLLAAVCFLFAFKGKRLPDLYKNSSFITISMLIYLVVWSLFIPVYINTPGKYVQAVQACAMLVSSYSILCCHFCPKCYVMIFRKELNDEKVILDYIKKHYEKKGVSVVTANR